MSRNICSGTLFLMAATPDPAPKIQALAELLDAEDTILVCIDAGEAVTVAEGRRLASLGFDPEQIGAPLSSLFAADSDALARWRRCLGGERLRVDCVQGDTQWLQLFQPRRGADGAIVGAAMLAVDVTVDVAAARHAQLLRELVNNVPTNVFAVDTAGICQISEGGLLAKAGLKPGQNVGIDVFEAYGGLPGLKEGLLAAFQGEQTLIEYALAGSVFSQMILPRRDSLGANAGAYCIVSDVTERRRDEALLRDQVRVIQEQKAAILQLSSPIIEVGHDVLAVPLVGTIDGDRAAIIVHGLLEAIVRKKASFAILDLTGVDTVDPDSAEHLVRIVRSVRLLGAQAIISGIRPLIAQTMADLGLNLAGLVTLRSLQDALRHCSDASAQAQAGDDTSD